MKFLSFLFSYNFSLRLRGIRNRLYTIWIKNFIGQLGHGSRIYSPCSLQGNAVKNIKIGNYTCVHSHSILGCWPTKEKEDPTITIGNHCSIGEYNHITAANKITIGDGLLTGHFVYIGDNSHGDLSWEEASIAPVKRQLKSKGRIVIGKNVWLGDRVSILGGVTIGDNVIVGANAVVTHDLPSNCVAVGMPARVIKTLK